MTYKTVQAYLQKNRISLPENIILPSNKIKVLITFIEENIDQDLYELSENEVTKELKSLSSKSLKKNKKIFTNI